MIQRRDQIHLCSDGEALAQYAAVWLTRLIDAHFRDEELRERPFALALSGGSTPKRMLQILAEQADRVDWSKVVLLWGDERNVAPDHADSNFLMVKENLLNQISIPADNILAIPSPGEDVFTAAKAYETILREKLTVERDGQPIIDCVLLGMGDDVHTASLFPGTKALSESKKTFVGNEVPQLETFRMTLTAPAINAARNVAFLISGEKKQEALLKLWHAEGPAEQLPSQLIRPTAGQLYFLIDKAALGDTPLPRNSLMQMI